MLKQYWLQPSSAFVAAPELMFTAAPPPCATMTGMDALQGDRCCLSLAGREKVTALTAERRWPEIADAVGVEVELIR